MLTAADAHAGLMRRLLAEEGGAFHYTVSLGHCESRGRLAANGWQPDGSSVSHEITQGAAACRALAKEFPALHITYPSRTLSSQLFSGGTARVLIRETAAEIDVPADFSYEAGGCAFRDDLLAEWGESAGELADLIAKRLRRHELRTVRMFGDAPAGEIAFTLEREFAGSEIWQIALADCGLYPLMWEREVFGMARLLRERLTAALAPDCGEALQIRLAYTENACRLILEY